MKRIDPYTTEIMKSLHKKDQKTVLLVLKNEKLEVVKLSNYENSSGIIVGNLYKGIFEVKPEFRELFYFMDEQEVKFDLEPIERKVPSSFDAYSTNVDENRSYMLQIHSQYGWIFLHPVKKQFLGTLGNIGNEYSKCVADDRRNNRKNKYRLIHFVN